MFTVKKRHNFTQRFDLQGHARVQIFTYKDVSVCNVSCTVNHSGARVVRLVNDTFGEYAQEDVL